MRPPWPISAGLALVLSAAPSHAQAQKRAAAPSVERASPPRQPAAAAAPQPRKASSRKSKGKSAEKLEGIVATYPGFRMLPDGASRVFVQVSGKIDVAESKSDGRVSYRMKGVQAIQTNRFPLVTAFFATPVTKVQLIDHGPDLDLVIDLRDHAAPTYHVLDTERGAVLQVDFPASAAPAASVAPAAAPTHPASSRRSRSMPATDDDASPSPD